MDFCEEQRLEYSEEKVCILKGKSGNSVGILEFRVGKRWNFVG